MLQPHAISINIKSSNKLYIKYFTYYFYFLLKKNKLNTLHIKKLSLPLILKKFTFLKSPHIDKIARTQLELRTTEVILKITNFTVTEQAKLKKLIIFFIKNLPLTLTITVKTTNN